MNNICEVREITNKEIQQITGRSERQSARLLTEIRKHLHKLRGQVITVAEFCRYKGYNQEEICTFLGIKQDPKK